MKRRSGAATPAKETKRCAIYTRKSTTMGLEQDFNSLDAQRDAGLAYIQKQPGWVLVDEHYDDGGFTGANIERPAFRRLLADVDAGKVDVIVVYKVDRLSRSLLDFAKVIERLSNAGASFVSVTQNFSTADAMGQLTMNMLMSFAEFERRMIGERTRDKIAASRRKGIWTGGPVPFGYTVDKKKLFVNEEEAPIVREAFELLLEHRQMAIVARRLNERGRLPRITSRTPKDRWLWTKDSVARILRSPLYAGVITYGEERYPGEHQGIIDEATFGQVQHIIDGASRSLRITGKNPHYVLRGLLRCGLCKRAMSPGSTTTKGKLYRFYRCTSRDKHGAGVCAAPALPAVPLEEFVADRIAAVSADRELLRRIEGALGEKTEAEPTGGDGAAVVDEASEGAEVVEAEGDEYEKALARRETRWMLETLRDFTGIWKLMTPENKGRLLRALVESVIVNEAKNLVEVTLVSFGAPPKTEEAA